MNELQSLSMIFQNKLFRIPDYQRGYAWQEFQLIDFWEENDYKQTEHRHPKRVPIHMRYVREVTNPFINKIGRNVGQSQPEKIVYLRGKKHNGNTRCKT